MPRSGASLILLSLMILLLGCSAGHPVNVQLYQTDCGRTVEMEPGDTLEIVLDGNPTTGYQWKIRPWDTAVVKEVEKEPVYQRKSDALGSGGQFTFYFEAADTGRTTLEFIYLRPFEKDVPPIKSFNVTIVVLKDTAPAL
ncbi:MAG: protease inhibitor I42 family protein [Deltaproteobacteria bacterium]|nr:protease inhibitor I42 family protein [Deltaproteobacteria bacterium]